jgi:2,2-dialkylglycine decarboxylase (pyruvate)
LRRLTERAREIDTVWKGCLRELAERHELIGDIRGRGLIQGIEFVLDRERRTPAFVGEQLGDLCLERGLILSVRRRGSVLRFVPPFTTSVAQLRRAAEILDEALSIVGRQSGRVLAGMAG